MTPGVPRESHDHELTWVPSPSGPAVSSRTYLSPVLTNGAGHQQLSQPVTDSTLCSRTIPAPTPRRPRLSRSKSSLTVAALARSPGPGSRDPHSPFQDSQGHPEGHRWLERPLGLLLCLLHSPDCPCSSLTALRDREEVIKIKKEAVAAPMK